MSEFCCVDYLDKGIWITMRTCRRDAIGVVAALVILGASFALCFHRTPIVAVAIADQAPAVSTNIVIGPNASLQGRVLFPADDAWNTDISKEPTDPRSSALISSIGTDLPLHPDFGSFYQGGPYGLVYTVVSGNQPRVPVKFSNDDESDPGPYPIPPDAPIEGGPNATDDRHVLIIDKDNWMLYELYNAFPVDGGRRWTADSGAVFDLSHFSMQRRPGWTSADAAGLPVFAGLARYDEIVERGVLTHALRFTVHRSRHAFVEPASHFASSNRSEDLAPMGMRVRLKADFDVSMFPASARVILIGLQRYGMIVADNGGNWFLSGTADSRWNDAEIQTLKKVHGSDFEVVRMRAIVTHVDD
jgi:hypothetical protein